MEMIPVLSLLLLAAYFLPTIVAAWRSHHRTATIAVLNFFLGWTLVGWVVSLAMAVGPIERPPADPADICPNCGHENDFTLVLDGERRCTECRTPMPTREQFAGQRAAAEKKCPYCESTITPAALKCRFCGEWVVPEAERPST